jgi:calcineurin-like phosphoesterase family protein
LCEYDFILKRLLFRREAKSRSILGETFEELKKQFVNKQTSEVKDEGEYQEISIKKTESMAQIPIIDLDKKSWYKTLFSLFRKPKIFFISDTHFDHANIIRFCHRPFDDYKEMNQTMLENWNKTVRQNDIVFFLGDLVCGKGSRHPDYWLKQLNGIVYIIRGNHKDKMISRKENVYDELIVKYKDQKFFLAHNPAKVPAEWKDWAICGHHHNNKPDEFSLVNKKIKRINVGVELIDYMPIEINELLSKR